MNKQNSQTGSAHLAIIIILILALAGALGFMVWQNFLQPKSDIGHEDTQVKLVTDDKYQKITKSELETIVTQRLGLLNGKTDVSKITNQEKLQLAASLYMKGLKNFNGTLIIKSAEIEDSLSMTGISTTDLVHESIKCAVVASPAHNQFEYNSDTKSYSYSDLGHGGPSGVPAAIYSKDTAFEEKNGQYSISYKYVFNASKGFGSDTDSIYGKYSDAESGINAIHTFTANANQNNGMIDTSDQVNYIKENFDSFEDKLSTYTYVFEKTDNKIRLVDISVR